MSFQDFQDSKTVVREKSSDSQGEDDPLVAAKAIVISDSDEFVDLTKEKTEKRKKQKKEKKKKRKSFKSPQTQ